MSKPHCSEVHGASVGRIICEGALPRNQMLMTDLSKEMPGCNLCCSEVKDRRVHEAVIQVSSDRSPGRWSSYPSPFRQRVVSCFAHKNLHSCWFSFVALPMKIRLLRTCLDSLSVRYGILKIWRRQFTSHSIGSPCLFATLNAWHRVL